MAAERAVRLLLQVNLQPELARLPFDVIQNQNTRVWEKGLRMAGGRCHRPPSLKHFGHCLVLSRFAPNLRKSPTWNTEIKAEDFRGGEFRPARRRSLSGGQAGGA
jgi:hypothetical protein